MCHHNGWRAVAAVVLVLGVGGRAFAQQPTVRVSAKALAALPQTAQQIADWQAQLDDAKARRSMGRRIQFSGLAIALIGAGINMRASVACAPRYSYNQDSCGGHMLGFVAMIGGTVAGIAGGIKAHDADGEVNALIARGPGRSTGGLSVSLTPQQKALTYRLTW